MKAIKLKKDTILMILASIIFISMIVYLVSNQRANDKIINSIHDPTFVGTVVGKETSTGSFGTFAPRFTVHRMHIIGEFIEGSERIQVNHVFVVPAEMYHRFEIGDVISHERD